MSDCSLIYKRRIDKSFAQGYGSGFGGFGYSVYGIRRIKSYVPENPEIFGK
jgi:hypothetical protein